MCVFERAGTCRVHCCHSAGARASAVALTEFAPPQSRRHYADHCLVGTSGCVPYSIPVDFCCVFVRCCARRGMPPYKPKLHLSAAVRFMELHVVFTSTAVALRVDKRWGPA